MDRFELYCGVELIRWINTDWELDSVKPICHVFESTFPNAQFIKP